MNKERVFNIIVLLGDTWEDTDRRSKLARIFCNTRKEEFVVRIDHANVSRFQLDHLRKGTLPFSTAIFNLADRIEFVDEDDSVKILKNRRPTSV